MVMSALRDKIKIIIMVTLLAFVGLIFFDWGMQKSGGGGGRSTSGAIAKVNGRDVPYDMYRRTRQSVLANFEQRTGRTAEFSDLDAIEDETWLSMLQETILQQQIDRYRITVSDAEILSILQTNPPDFLRFHPDFLNEAGEFDPVRYTQALSNPAFDWTPVENYIRASMPRDKLQNYVGLNARVTSAEVRERFLAQNERVKVRYVQSLPASVELPEDAVGQDDLRAWFDSHRDDYRVGRQAVLEVVRVSKAPSAQDSSDVRDDLEDVRGMVLDGTEDFETAATRYSDDASSQRGGDLGFIARGDMPSELEDVAFSLDPGQISEVFVSPFGLHFLKVEERKKEDGEEKVHARHVLMRIEPSNTTLREASRRIGGLLDGIADGGDFRAVAGRLGLDVETTPPFERGHFVPGLGLLRGAHRFAFSSEPGAVTSDPIEDADWIYAFRLAEIQPPRARTFDEVREGLRAVVTNEKKREVAKEKLEAAIAAGDGTLKGIAKALGAPVDTTGEFTRESFVPGIGRRNAFIAAAFALPEGQVSRLVDSDRGFYVLEVRGRIPADEAALVEQRDSIRQQLLFEKRQALFVAWMEQQLMDAEVVDYRSGFAVDWAPDPSELLYVGPGA